MNKPTVFVSDDSAARSVGAAQIAEHLETTGLDGQSPDVVRVGSRGLYWLEPMIEVADNGRRIAYGPLTKDTLSGILNNDGSANLEHPACRGATDEIAELACQQRLTFKRVGIVEPLSIDDYQAHEGYAGLKAALGLSADDLINEVRESGLRGRGGAAFPTGIKWKTVQTTEAPQKYIVCNADEGDSGTFADRMIMESDPYCLIEGMTIAGIAVGATKGYLYIRAEYPQAIETMTRAIELARDAGFLGDKLCGSEHTFDMEVRKAAGAYICGEETSLLESLEGKRGMVRYRPPLPAIKGLFGAPTVVNNVISLASVPGIVLHGAASYQEYGQDRSRGTLTVQLAGNIRRGGLYELPFGHSLRDLLENLGGGSASGRPIKAVQAGGPLGAFIPEADFDMPLDYEAFKERGAMVGHGGLVVFDDQADMGELARFSMEFCAIESCGKCTPCRVGAVRGTEVIDKIRAGDNATANRELLEDLCTTMVDGSLCALGGMAPFPVISVLKHFPDEL
ncbi:MAG: NADH-ubiquinone oxidoreductase-F iron-sulfur binding region domain-containing protein [Pseudomonadota bacterium]